MNYNRGPKKKSGDGTPSLHRVDALGRPVANFMSQGEQGHARRWRNEAFALGFAVSSVTTAIRYLSQSGMRRNIQGESRSRLRAESVEQIRGLPLRDDMYDADAAYTRPQVGTGLIRVVNCRPIEAGMRSSMVGFNVEDPPNSTYRLGSLFMGELEYFQQAFVDSSANLLSKGPAFATVMRVTAPHAGYPERIEALSQTCAGLLVPRVTLDRVSLLRLRPPRA